MKKNEQELYEVLGKKKVTYTQSLHLVWAIKELANAVSASSAWNTLNHTTDAIRHINSFRQTIIPAIKLTEEEAHISGILHTYMRKGMDSHLGTMLYRLIAEDYGTNIWYAFVKGLAANKINFREGIENAEMAYSNGNDTTHDLFMLKTLWMWELDFPDAVEWLRECCPECAAKTRSK